MVKNNLTQGFFPSEHFNYPGKKEFSWVVLRVTMQFAASLRARQIKKHYMHHSLMSDGQQNSIWREITLRFKDLKWPSEMSKTFCLLDSPTVYSFWGNQHELINADCLQRPQAQQSNVKLHLKVKIIYTQTKEQVCLKPSIKLILSWKWLTR